MDHVEDEANTMIDLVRCNFVVSRYDVAALGVQNRRDFFRKDETALPLVFLQPAFLDVGALTDVVGSAGLSDKRVISNVTLRCCEYHVEWSRRECEFLSLLLEFRAVRRSDHVIVVNRRVVISHVVFKHGPAQGVVAVRIGSRNSSIHLHENLLCLSLEFLIKNSVGCAVISVLFKTDTTNIELFRPFLKLVPFSLVKILSVFYLL